MRATGTLSWGWIRVDGGNSRRVTNGQGQGIEGPHSGYPGGDEPVRVDRLVHRMESCTAVQYVSLCTCSRTGKEMEAAAAIWQVGNRGAC